MTPQPAFHDVAPTPADDIRSTIAEMVKRRRAAQSLTLRDLAELTGLSAALLSQIERATANPTLDALSRIASALKVSFSELTRRDEARPLVIRAGHGPIVAASNASTVVHTLFESSEPRRFDVSIGRISAEEESPRASHGSGSIEYAFVVSGRVDVSAEDWTVTLGTGDAVRFSGAGAHAYRAIEETAEILTIVSLPNDWSPDA